MCCPARLWICASRWLPWRSSDGCNKDVFRGTLGCYEAHPGEEAAGKVGKAEAGGIGCLCGCDRIAARCDRPCLRERLRGIQESDEFCGEQKKLVEKLAKIKMEEAEKLMHARQKATDEAALDRRIDKSAPGRRETWMPSAVRRARRRENAGAPGAAERKVGARPRDCAAGGQGEWRWMRRSV